jgi:hypothetical protein
MYFNNKSASFLEDRNHIYLFLKSLYKFLSFCHISYIILAISECALSYKLGDSTHNKGHNGACNKGCDGACDKGHDSAHDMSPP